MDERQSKRDLVLAPSEYAYMQDVTKGIVKTYTGPTVINPTAQERPVLFNEASKRFEPCSLEPQRSGCGAGPFDPGHLHYLRPQLLRHRDPPPAMLRSPLCQPGVGQGQSRSSAHA